MSAPGSTSTRWTVWPLMSMPRICSAWVRASAGVLATLTPPALPRPPILTCALTTVTPPSFSAIALASSGVVATSPRLTGTPYFWNSCFAWYSNRSTLTQSYLCLVRTLFGIFRGITVTDVGRDPSHDLVQWRTGREDLRDTGVLELRDVGVGDDPAAEDDHVVDVVGLQQFQGLGEQRHVRAGQDRQPDGVGVLLDDGLDDLLRGLVQPGVDHLHARVAQGARDDLRAAVVTVEPRLRHDHSDFSRHGWAV